MRLRTAFLWIMVASLSLAAAMGVVVVLFERTFGRFGERAAFTALLVGAYSLVCLACAIVIDRKKLVGVMWTGIGTSLASLVLWLFLIWFDWWIGYVYDDAVAKSAGTFTTVCVWAAHLGLLSLPPLRREAWRTIRLVTFAVTAMLALSVLGIMWTEEFEDWTGKLLAILSILASCGTVVTPVLSLIEHLRLKQQPTSLGKRIQVSLTCPRCGIEQRLPAGRARCAQCGLRINMDIEEPLCECGYLLYELTGKRCPECGREIAEGSRWASQSASANEAS